MSLKRKAKKTFVSMQMSQAGLACYEQKLGKSPQFSFYQRHKLQPDMELMASVSKRYQQATIKYYLPSSNYQLHVCPRPHADPKEFSAIFADDLSERLDLDIDDVICDTFVNPNAHSKTQNEQVFVVLCSKYDLIQQQNLFKDNDLSLHEMSIMDLGIVDSVGRQVPEDCFLFLYWQGSRGYLLAIEHNMLTAKCILPGLGEITDFVKMSDVFDQFILAIMSRIHEIMQADTWPIYINPTAVAHEALLGKLRLQLDYTFKSFKWSKGVAEDDLQTLYRHGLATGGVGHV